MPNTIQLPDLKDRIQALFIDMLISFVFAFIAVKVFEQIGEVSSDLRMWTFIAIFVLYDPLLTSFFGGTIGHRSLNLRVRRANDTSKNVMIPLAILRYVIKAFLGIVSLITVSTNSQGKAIHDLLSGSIVIYKEKK